MVRVLQGSIPSRLDRARLLRDPSPSICLDRVGGSIRKSVDSRHSSRTTVFSTSRYLNTRERGVVVFAHALAILTSALIFLPQ